MKNGKLYCQSVEWLESDEGQEIWSKEQLQNFESETGIILPNDYKTFCQVFGTGLLGDYMRIYCPSLVMSNFFLNSVKHEIDKFPEVVDSTLLDIESLQNLLSSAFMFGENFNSDIVF